MSVPRLRHLMRGGFWVGSAGDHTRVEIDAERIQESSMALHASPVSVRFESWMCRNPSQEIRCVRQRMPGGPRRRNDSPCRLNMTPSGSFTGQVPSTATASSIASRLKGLTLQTEPATITRTSAPLGCTRTPSTPPSPGLKFPTHFSPLGDSNSTTSPSWHRDFHSVGKETARGPYGGSPGSFRNDVIVILSPAVRSNVTILPSGSYLG